jgi:hypothetical protein
MRLHWYHLSFEKQEEGWKNHQAAATNQFLRETFFNLAILRLRRDCKWGCPPSISDH